MFEHMLFLQGPGKVCVFLVGAVTWTYGLVEYEVGDLQAQAASGGFETEAIWY